MAMLPRPETVAAYKAADLFLFPSNVECSPLVLFECMASRTPFLSTDVGNAAEIIEWSGGGNLLPTLKDPTGHSYARVAESAALLEAIYQAMDQRRNMAESGFKAWQQRFNWEVITEKYENLYASLVDGRIRAAAT
jgi:glycosyltransferase involved in cell wall biosynthesis